MASMEESLKSKVIMTNDMIDEEGRGWHFEATDSVPNDELEAYVADARLRWSNVVVSNN